jgi:hypothetical protein
VNGSIIGAGGNYGNPCRLADEFRVDVGRFEVIGPYPLTQDRTCVAGQTCSFAAIQAHSPNENDQILLLDTCGVAASERNNEWIRGYCGKLSLNDTVPLFPTVDFEILDESHGLTAEECRQSCSTWNGSTSSCVAALFKDHDSGQPAFTSSGYFSIGHCVLYSKCTPISDTSYDYIVFFMSLQGQRNLEQMIPRFPNHGLVSLEASILPFEVNASNAISWGSTVVTAAGGLYRLCWCADSYICSTTESFVVDVGSFTLIGPAPLLESRTCISGQTCVVEGFVGVGLMDDDRYVFTDTCGQVLELPRFVNHGLTTSFASGAIIDFGSVALTAEGGMYRMCWCATGFACSNQESFTVDVGEVLLLGPSPLGQSRTCVSGQKCVLEDVTGSSLNQLDQIAILSTCGMLEGNGRFPHDRRIPAAPTGGLPNLTLGNLPSLDGTRHRWATDEISAAGGYYRLCWCAYNDQNYPCSGYEEFRVDFGELLIVGPAKLSNSYTCVSGQTCQLRFFFSDEASRQRQLTEFNQGDQLRVQDTCGAATVIPRYANDALATVTTDSGARFSWGTLLLSSAAGQYRLCWCAAGYVCNAPDNFRVDVGEFTLYGPVEIHTERTCVTGRPCEFALDGADSFAAYSGYEGSMVLMDTCAVPPNLYGGSFPSIEQYPDDTYHQITLTQPLVSWGDVHLTSVGGQFRMCWCASSFEPTPTNSTLSSVLNTSTLLSAASSNGSFSLLNLAQASSYASASYSCSL